MPRGMYKRKKKVSKVKPRKWLVDGQAEPFAVTDERGRVEAQSEAKAAEQPAANNPISPAHYQQHPSGIECITITEHFNFNRGNAIKYIWRADAKGSTLENLRKAQWYLTREIERLEKEALKYK